MKLKALAAVVALAFAGTANAAFDRDGVGLLTGTGAGSVVLSVVDDTSSVDTSIAIDLGVVSGEFMDGTVSGVILTGNADLNDFLSSATGTVKWDVVATHNSSTTYDNGVLQTVVGGVMPAHSTQQATNAMNQQGSWMDSIKGVATGNVAIFADATAPGGHYDTTGRHQAIASGSPYASESLLGETVDFLAILGEYGPNAMGKDLLDFTLNWDGSNATLNYGTAAVVPVPAAAWLFGSAMLGMVGVARRKAA
jgi:hypothetical protein